MRRDFFLPTSHAAPHPDADRIGGPLVIAVAAATARERYYETTRHSHRRGQLTLAMAGLIILHLHSEIRVILPGHSIWIPPDCMHSFHYHPPFGQLGLYFDGPACQRLAGCPAVIPTSALLRETALRAATWAERRDALDAQKQRVVAMLTDEILVLPIDTFTLALPRDRRLRAVTSALIDSPMADLDLDGWSYVAGTNARTLSRRFIADTGFTFVEWRQRARLLRSIELLTTDTPIAEIATELGYSSPSAYGSVFKQILGQTPTAFRKHLMANPHCASPATAG